MNTDLLGSDTAARTEHTAVEQCFRIIQQDRRYSRKTNIAQLVGESPNLLNLLAHHASPITPAAFESNPSGHTVHRSAFDPPRSAPPRFAPPRSAPPRSAPPRYAPLRSAPLRYAL